MFELSQTKSSPSEIRAALEECSKAHKQLMKEAVMGGYISATHSYLIISLHFGLSSTVFNAILPTFCLFISHGI